MYCQGQTTIRRELRLHILNADSRYPGLDNNERTKCLLKADNKDTSKVIGKYIHLMFQKRKEILNSQM